MKTKITVLLIASALITLSFTFSSLSKNDKKTKEVGTQKVNNEPVGGLGSEDKL